MAKICLQCNQERLRRSTTTFIAALGPLVSQATRRLRTCQRRAGVLESPHPRSRDDARAGRHRAFFDDLDAYRFDKLDYLPKVVDFASFSGQRVLEIGCGIDTISCASAAVAPGPRGSTLPKRRFGSRAKTSAFTDYLPRGWPLRTAASCRWPARPSTSFTRMASCSTLPDPVQMIAEAYRVLRPGGRAVFMVYNRVSWLNAMSKLMKVPLEHEDAPVLRNVLDRRVSRPARSLFSG